MNPSQPSPKCQPDDDGGGAEGDSGQQPRPPLAAGPRRHRTRDATSPPTSEPRLQSASSQPLAARLLLEDGHRGDADLDQSRARGPSRTARRTDRPGASSACASGSPRLRRGVGVPQRPDHPGEDEAAERAAGGCGEQGGVRAGDRDQDADQGRARR